MPIVAAINFIIGAISLSNDIFSIISTSKLLCSEIGSVIFCAENFFASFSIIESKSDMSEILALHISGNAAEDVLYDGTVILLS